jgi:shikimate kinase / 3-dehydroquinate synthase
VASPLTDRALVFAGFMGAGKTVAARAVAAAWGVEPIDTDALLERELGVRIPDFFAEQGEEAFRLREEVAVAHALDQAPPGSVMALGGGALGSMRVREALKRHLVVWLDVDVDTCWARAGEQGDRPLARDPAAFTRLFQDRQAAYEAAADAVVLNRSLDAVPSALPALVDLAGRPRDTRLLWAWSASAQYPVLLRDGLLGDEAVTSWPAEGRRFLVTDGAVAKLYADRLEPLAGRVSIMPGEQSKTIAHAEIVWTELVRAGLTRTDHVVALGGGVVGDLAGFCAATYQRGVPIVHVPTTVVAQVDSAYGGKTAVDLAEAKNYVGAYHQPRAVLVDPETLHTLPPAERAAGYAEVVKTALIAGGRLWDRVRVGASVADGGVISACALTKLRVVAQDERDSGRRQVLNLGHTVAHAIETATGYARYRHGEAVGLGLLAALRLSGLDGLREEVAELLEAGGLPTTLDADVEAVLAATARDKKRVGEGPVPFVVVHAPGDVRPGAALPEGEVRAAVTELASASG